MKKLTLVLVSMFFIYFIFVLQRAKIEIEKQEIINNESTLLAQKFGLVQVNFLLLESKYEEGSENKKLLLEEKEEFQSQIRDEMRNLIIKIEKVQKMTFIKNSEKKNLENQKQKYWKHLENFSY